jgi:hypothetical protein
MAAPRGRIWAETGNFVGFIESPGTAIACLAMNNERLHFAFITDAMANRLVCPQSLGRTAIFTPGLRQPQGQDSFRPRPADSLSRRDFAQIS